MGMVWMGMVGVWMGGCMDGCRDEDGVVVCNSQTMQPGFLLFINPFTATACKISRLKSAHSNLQNSTLSGPTINLFSVLCEQYFNRNPFMPK